MEKKVPSIITESIWRTKYFKDDLIELIELLRKRDLIIEIADSSYTYESLEELKNHKGRYVKDLNISARTKEHAFSKISIDININYTVLYVSGDTNLISFGYEVEKLLREKKVSPINFLLTVSRLKVILLIFLFFFTTLWFIPFLSTGEKKDFNLWLVTAFVLIGTFVYNQFNPLYERRIDLENRHASNFIDKYKEQLLLSIVNLIIGAILGFSLNWIINNCC